MKLLWELLALTHFFIAKLKVTVHQVSDIGSLEPLAFGKQIRTTIHKCDEILVIEHFYIFLLYKLKISLKR